jgi:hypothetical protein
MTSTTTLTITPIQTARAQLVAARANADRAAADLRDLINDKADARAEGAMAIAIAKVELRRAAQWVRTCQDRVRDLGGNV